MTETTQVLTLEDLVWPDERVRAADSGFPIQWLEGDQELEETKVWLLSIPTEQGGGYAVMLWTKGTGSGPVMHSLRRVTEIETINRFSRIMTLEDGAIVQYGPSRHCGCGSRLRTLRPWGDRRVIAIRKPSLPWTRD